MQGLQAVYFINSVIMLLIAFTDAVSAYVTMSMRPHLKTAERAVFLIASIFMATTCILFVEGSQHL